ncbi:glutathione S-transferase [Aspergillus floccosus]
MTTTLEVWGRRDSSNVQAVIWCIAELQLPYKRHDVGHRFGGNDTPEYLAMNPNGRIPVLRDGDSEPLWESGAINRYLASAYGSDEFWPKDPLARAQVDKWAEWAKVTVTGAFSVPIFWQLVRTPPSKRDPVAIRKAVAELDPILDIAEAQLSRQKFLAGEVFTLADVQFGSLLFRYFDVDIERKERPFLQRYYEALQARPAYREHVMVDYGALRAFD